MVKYRDANTETKYHEGYGGTYENMDDTMESYTATSN